MWRGLSLLWWRMLHSQQCGSTSLKNVLFHVSDFDLSPLWLLLLRKKFFFLDYSKTTDLRCVHIWYWVTAHTSLRYWPNKYFYPWTLTHLGLLHSGFQRLRSSNGGGLLWCHCFGLDRGRGLLDEHSRHLLQDMVENMRPFKVNPDWWTFTWCLGNKTIAIALIHL